MSFINGGLSRMFLGVVGEWDDPRLVDSKRGSMFGSGRFCLNSVDLIGVIVRIDNQAGATGRLHHRRTPSCDRCMLCLREGRKGFSEELIAEGNDFFLAHRGQCHSFLRKPQFLAKDFE